MQYAPTLVELMGDFLMRDYRSEYFPCCDSPPQVRHGSLAKFLLLGVSWNGSQFFKFLKKEVYGVLGILLAMPQDWKHPFPESHH